MDFSLQIWTEMPPSFVLCFSGGSSIIFYIFYFPINCLNYVSVVTKAMYGIRAALGMNIQIISLTYIRLKRVWYYLKKKNTGWNNNVSDNFWSNRKTLICHWNVSSFNPFHHTTIPIVTNYYSKRTGLV